MGKRAEWFEGFFEGLYAQVLGKQFDRSRSLEQARLVKQVLHVRKGQRVLDVPCGEGRLTIPLAHLGLAMTGVDLTARFLARARRDANRDRLDIRFLKSDMREIDFHGEFHAAFNWFGSFGYFSDAGNLAFARRVFEALKPGGRFLIEGMNKSWLLSHFREQDEQTVGRIHIQHKRRFDFRTSRVIDHWALSDGRTTDRQRISMRLYNGTEIRRLLRTAGFREVQLYGWPPLGRFTRHSRRFLAVGRRPQLGDRP
jgi:SAM-dependent methyltransferase